MMRLLEQIDLQRLAGIRRVLGIDKSESHIRVVELERRGSPFNKYSARFRVVKSCSCEVTVDGGNNEHKKQLIQLLKQHHIRATYCVSSIPSLCVRTLAAVVPPDVEDIPEWVNSHHGQILKLPLMFDELTYRFEILHQSARGSNIEVSFVRNSDIQEHESFFQDCRLQLLALGIGTRDALNALIVSGNELDGEIQFCHRTSVGESISVIKDGKRIDANQRTPDSETDRRSPVIQMGNENSSSRQIICGELDGLDEHENITVLKPFGLATEYTLAAGLAVKGFLPAIHSVDVLSRTRSESNESDVWKKLSLRLATALGTIIISLSSSEILIGHSLTLKIDALHNQTSSLGNLPEEVRKLDRHVGELEALVNRNTAIFERSMYAKFMHDLASVTPAGVWYSKLMLEEKGSNTLLSLSGSATSNDALTVFLNHLQKQNFCTQVEILHSGLSPSREGIMPARNAKKPVITFELKANIQPVSVE